MVWCQVVSVEEIVVEEELEDCGGLEADFVFCVSIVEMVLECEDGVVVAGLDISLSTGSNSPPLGLPEGSNGGLWCGVEECLVEGKGRVEGFGVDSVKRRKDQP